MPDPRERMAKLMMQMRMFITNQGTCGNCTGWQLRSAELKNGPGANNIDVGSWEPMQGLMLMDDLFPHVTGGFRGRRLKVASIHVSRCHKLSQAAASCLKLVQAVISCSFSIHLGTSWNLMDQVR